MGRVVLITGGAGYIGSLLTGRLLARGDRVICVDKLLFGGESVIPYLAFPNYRFIKHDVGEIDAIGEIFEGVDVVIHLSGLVGFPVCKSVGESVAMLYNFESTKSTFALAERHGVRQYIFASTYSNYGKSQDGNPVTEDSPLFPQSLYAETKIRSEEFLLDKARSSRVNITIPRLATLFGISPRTRFDLIVNQFVLEALQKGELILYQGNYTRSFVHVRDVVEGIILMIEAEAEKTRGQIFNLGSGAGNYTKEEIIGIISKAIPKLKIIYRDISFGEDMRDVGVSFEKIERLLGFRAAVTVEDGVREVKEAVESGLIEHPESRKYRNFEFIVQ